jgi:glycolate oxidase FAD binding subunit
LSSLRRLQRPDTTGELEHILRAAGSHKQTVTLFGNASKRLMAGPVEDSDVNLSMAGMSGVLEYEPRDLTVSVRAGTPWRELAALAKSNGQILPLDPPFAADATVGGVVASNSSGPRRRLYGTARDMVIGMHFLTLEGKTVQTGGMVVKNVAGLDMGKLLIGSFGALAAITVVNFKLIPAPEKECTFLLAFVTLSSAVAARDGVLKSVLQPSAIDLLSPEAGAAVGNRAWLLALRVGGNAAVIDRYAREFAALGDIVALDGEAQDDFWRRVEEFTPDYLATHPQGAVARASCTLKETEALLETINGPAVMRAGSGVCYACFDDVTAAAAWMTSAAGRGWKVVMEFAPDAARNEIELWPAPGGDFETMRRVKQMFDPDGLLNRGRMYRRI